MRERTREKKSVYERKKKDESDSKSKRMKHSAIG